MLAKPLDNIDAIEAAGEIGTEMGSKLPKNAGHLTIVQSVISMPNVVNLFMQSPAVAYLNSHKFAKVQR